MGLHPGQENPRIHERSDRFGAADAGRGSRQDRGAGAEAQCGPRQVCGGCREDPGRRQTQGRGIRGRGAARAALRYRRGIAGTRSRVVLPVFFGAQRFFPRFRHARRRGRHVAGNPGLPALMRGLAFVSAVLAAAAMSGTVGAARADPTARAAAPPEASQRVEARSADLLAVGLVRGNRMTIHLSRLLDNAPVRDAAVTVALRGAAHPAVAETDGSYTLETPELAVPGAVAGEFEVEE